MPDLQDLPTGAITKIAAGGYAVLVLTEGNDLYAWGAGGRAPLPLSGGPAPLAVVVDGVEADDVLDCAVGDAHAVVLVGGAQVYVVGANGNGQLGLAAGGGEAPAPAAVESWTPVAVPPGAGPVVAVAAGPRSSFIVTRQR